MNYKDKQKDNEKKITDAYGYIPNESGIYVFTRYEGNFKFAYVGQAKHLRKRIAEHLKGFQHIDLSIKSHGFYNENNPTGWQLCFQMYNENELDNTEQFYIEKYANAGYQMRNKTAGGQRNGHFNINEAREPKGYRDGIKQGEKVALRLISNFFDKYLNYSIKEPINKVKERKLNEFAKILENKEI